MRILADANMRGVEVMFSNLGEVLFADGRRLQPSQLNGIDVLLVRSVTRVNAELLRDHNPSFIGTATAGVEHIDRELLRQRGIAFASAPGANAESVADYVLSAIVNAEGSLARLRAGGAVGIVGYGHVGRCLGRRLDALGIDWRAHDPWLDTNSEQRLASLAEVLACPVVSVHASLTLEAPWPSRGLLGSPELEMLPPDALFINAARGDILRQEDLPGLANRRPDIRLVLDVWANEPQIDRDLLEHCLYGTAHIAGYSLDSKIRATHRLYLALCEHLDVAPLSREHPAEPAAVAAPPALEGDALLRWLVNECYDIRTDDALLRAAGPDEFDRLRKHYRDRRELGLLRIDNADALTAEQRAICRALGCEVA